VSTTASQHYRGERLGLPAEGTGSLAPTGTRVLALLVDCAASGLIASLFVRRSDLHGAASHLPGSWSLIPLAIDYVVGLLLGGQTLGMHLFGVRVVRIDGGPGLSPLLAAMRTAILFALIPAVIVDRDARGLHDRLTGTAAVRA
jgi:uncharacterized RDD family membrane protein YckC